MTNTAILDRLPQALTEMKLRPLLAVRLEVAPPALFGRGPDRDRRVRVVTGGQFGSRHKV